MKISILGAGNAGCAVAADLTLKGHEVTLIKTSHSMHDDNFEYLQNNDGKMVLNEFGEIKTAYISKVTRDLTQLKNSEVVIIYIQTNYHEQLIEKISDIIENNQILLINPGYLSTAYVLKHCNDKKVIVAEAESSFIDGRIMEPGYFRVGFRNVRNPIGIYPRERKEEAIRKLDKLDERFVYLDSVVEAAIHNPNLIVHTVGSVMSIPRIEKSKGDFCMYHEAYTRDNPSTWNILEALDKEKMSVLKKMGFKELSYVEACKYRNSLNESEDAKEVFLNYAEMDTRAKGPIKVDSRYISEDVPQGLVMLESLGKTLNVETPIASSLINIASAALDRNLRNEGRTLDKLDKNNIEKILEDSNF
ncbi:NAD/NADP octopine/nopaline dehydrogenase family protein [Finegoldia magna]|uniref:NAD/NADP octopine/nopaline dehydrogenase family protein n=1 Tax=Finegoldia magna TaxID=1260 RepID=UPI002901F2CE|nr:NAD/NADP octopine/nopaline dehydrogenase family protein [Finegoldia magna]MDU2218975.1 NAD/NADP octopine/nopaline dehydrogenase family protein [Finegoldia magna]